MRESSLDELVADWTARVTIPLAAVDWAEEEITLAIGRHPSKRDQLFHSFPVLTPSTILLPVEFIYRSHIREILTRVAAGKDTRPATAAEACCLLAEISKATPLPSYGYGLYLRMWKEAFPDHQQLAPNSQLDHYEAVFGPRIDKLEGEIRKGLTVEDRQIGPIVCDGAHNGAPVDCIYTSTR